MVGKLGPPLYLELAKLTDVDAIITISNEFARIPSELPYHLDSKKVGR